MWSVSLTLMSNQEYFFDFQAFSLLIYIHNPKYKLAIEICPNAALGDFFFCLFSHECHSFDWIIEEMLFETRSPTPKGQEKKVFSTFKGVIRRHIMKRKPGALKTQCSWLKWPQPGLSILTTQALINTILALPGNTPQHMLVCWWNPPVFTGYYVPNHYPGPTGKYRRQEHFWDSYSVRDEADSQETEGSLGDIVASSTSVQGCDKTLASCSPLVLDNMVPNLIKEDHVSSSRQWVKSNWT